MATNIVKLKVDGAQVYPQTHASAVVGLETIQGPKGDKGDTGATGATGNGIQATAITYAVSSSGQTAPASGWSGTIPSVSAGQYLWTKTYITYTNGSNSTSYAVGRMGEQGPKGDTGSTGPQGPKGDTGPQGPAGTNATTTSTATTTANGLMSSTDKSKLDSIPRLSVEVVGSV